MLLSYNVFVSIFAILLYIIKINYQVQDVLIKAGFIVQLNILFL